MIRGEIETFVEQDCTFTHEGHTFEAGGAVVMPEFAIGYVKSRVGYPFDSITDWHGNHLGRIVRVVSFHQWQPSCGYSIPMHQVTARIGDTLYTGRTQGEGMIWRGKPASIAFMRRHLVV